MAKISRNSLCHCGSGLKYKRCHGRLDGGPAPADISALFERADAEHRLREAQQGRGKPIVSAKVGDHQIVGVGNTIYWSKEWKAFPDFLADYVKRKVGSDWGNAEIAKPFEDRHPLMQWYETYCKYQQKVITNPGKVNSYPIVGVVACYLGVAYAIYLLDHNVELQARLIGRLKDPGQFQGAYYELMVASILIRAGFALTLEDETDADSKHCEFAAVSKRTGKRYWVEAKMRAVRGLLGRTAADGGHDAKPLKQLIPHLNKALAKPAADERLVFIDLNAPVGIQPDGSPDWLEPAMQRLEKFEKAELAADTTAYIFITNFSFHRQLHSDPVLAASPFGLGMPDFNRPGWKNVVDAYRQKKKHIDAHEIGDAINQYLRFPSTFDGKLPSEAFGRATNRVVIGETYEFPDDQGAAIVGKVTTAICDERAKEAIVGVSTTDNRGLIIRIPMTDDDVAEYKEFPDVYFGQIRPVSRKAKNQFEMFEWLMEAYAKSPRAKMLEWFGPAWDTSELEKLSDDDLRLRYCQAVLAAIDAKSKPKAPPPASSAV